VLKADKVSAILIQHIRNVTRCISGQAQSLISSEYE
jgi:hypothetical protein